MPMSDKRLQVWRRAHLTLNKQMYLSSIMNKNVCVCVDRCSCQMKGRDMLVFGVCGAEIMLTKLLVGCGLIPRMKGQTGHQSCDRVIYSRNWEDRLGGGEEKCYFLIKYSDVWWISHHFWHGACLKLWNDEGHWWDSIRILHFSDINPALQDNLNHSRGTPVHMQAPWQQHNRNKTVRQALLTRWKVQVKHEFKQEGGQNEAWDSPISFNSANQVTRNKGSPVNP